MTGRPIILDCTIRDGSYAIDFKFTADDTATIAEQLEGIGVRYIEVGHGLGLGASEAGKGAAAAHDLAVLERTRERVHEAKVGVFFIPGIGTEEHLRAAAAAGLDFVRIGQNADEIDQTWPFVELARHLGLEPFVNFMKTYGIAPSAFAESSSVAGETGAAGVYVVDSAGGMLPHEVTAYVQETRAVTDIPVGFHGHSNLHLAVANSLAALDAGATFVDTSLYGIGRSSGNVPTEVMVAVLDRLGIDTGIDAQAAIDVAEAYLRPLAEHLHPHDMTAVSLGYGRFHSSFLPKALAAAAANGINPFRLIVELGRRDMMNLPDALLDEVVAELRDQQPPEVRREVTAFSDDRFGARRINNRPEAVGELIDGLEVIAAKRHLEVAVDVVLSSALADDSVSAEFVLQDEAVALGRVRSASAAGVASALAPHAARIDYLLVPLDGIPVSRRQAELAELEQAFAGKVAPYRGVELELGALVEHAAAAAPSSIALVDAGWYEPTDVAALEVRLAAVAPTVRAASVESAEAELVVVAGPAGADAATGAVYLGARALSEPPAGAIVIGRDDVLRSRVAAWRAAVAARAARATAQAAV